MENEKKEHEYHRLIAKHKINVGDKISEEISDGTLKKATKFVLGSAKKFRTGY